MIKLASTITLSLAACTSHAQSALESAMATDYCQQQAEHEYQLRIQTPPIFPEVYPGQYGGQAGQAAAYAGVWSQRVFMECMRRMEESHRSIPKGSALENNRF